MESNKTKMVLQFTEGSFYPPAHFVDFLDIIGQKLTLRKIGNKSFIYTFRYLDPYDEISTDKRLLSLSVGNQKPNLN